MQPATRVFLGGVLGLLAFSSVAALVIIAVDTAYESQTVAGGGRIHAHAALAIVAVCGVFGFLLGMAFGNEAR